MKQHKWQGVETGKKNVTMALAIALGFCSSCLLPSQALGAEIDKVESVPANLSGDTMVNGLEEMTMSVEGVPNEMEVEALSKQLTQLQAHPEEALRNLKASSKPQEVALYQVLSHPDAVMEEQESLSKLVGPKNFKALIKTVLSLNDLAGQNMVVRDALSAGVDPASAVEEFKSHFDGTASVRPQDTAAAIPAHANMSENKSNRPELRPAAASPDSSVDRNMLALAEKIARGITKDEGLKLVPWEAVWSGDRPDWRLVKEGEHLNIQYVPEDLRHANKEVAMAHLMQEVLRAVKSRPDLIEPELQANGLFQTLYDTMETGRVVQEGIKEMPGLEKNFLAFNQELYKNPKSEAVARSLQQLPAYLQFLEGALYESRQGQEDPRIKDARVRKMLKDTSSLRRKIAQASPEQAYRLDREIWPTLQEVYAQSEDAAMSQKLFEKKGQEGKLSLDKEQNAAAGQGQLKLDDLSQKRREGMQKELEKFLQSLTPEQREELRRQVQAQMRQQEQAFRKTLGKSESSPQKNKKMDGLTQQLEQAASRLAQQAAQAKAQAQNLEEKASQMRAQTGAKDLNAQDANDLDAQAARLHQQASNLNQSAQEFRRMAEQLKSGASSTAAEQTLEQAKQLDGMGKDLEAESRQLQNQIEALKKQLEKGQGEETSSMRQKAAGIEETSKDIGEKAGKIQEEAQKAQALAEALGQQLNGSQGSPGSQGKSGSEPQPGQGKSGQEDALEQMLQAWAKQKSGESSGQGEAGESQNQQESSQGESQDKSSDGEINPSGTQGTSDSVGNIEEKIQKIKSGGLDAGQRSWLEQYLEPVRSMVDTLAYKIRKHLKATVLGRDLTGLYEGDVDEEALAYYKAKIGIMKEELLPGRPKARITIMLDLSGSMGKIEGGGSLDHAARALLMALKAFRLAFKSERGVEVRVVAYNENAQLPIIGGYMQARDLSDAVLYKIIERINEIQNSCKGDNCEVRMMNKAVSDIRDDMKKHPDATHALLHIGDGDPGAQIAPLIRAIYDDPANAKIRFANLAAGPQAQDMYEKYQPYSFWARELSELGTKWAEIIEATFKKSWRRQG